MNDGDIQFPPGKRREAPKFEPPPWEREQFEELAKAREAQEPPASAEQQEPAPAQPAEPAVQQPEATEPAEPARKQGVTEEQMALLLSGLRAEEPRASESYVMVSMVVGIALAVIGLAVTTWGVIVLITPKEQGATTFILLSGLLIPGLGFLGGGVWLVISSLRRQGVL